MVNQVETDRMDGEFARPLNALLTKLSAERLANPEPEALEPTLLERALSRLALRDPPATEAQIIQQLAVLHLVYPERLSETERSSKYRLYCADLSHLSEAKLAAACRRYRQSAEKFYPTPGQLIALARAE